MVKHFIETAYGRGSYTLSRVADTREEAEKALLSFKDSIPEGLGANSRIVRKEIPDDTEELFLYAANLLSDNGVSIDDYGLNKYMIHIGWGDWKHSHLHADYIMGLFGFELVKEVETHSDGSDCYSAWRIYKSKQPKAAHLLKAVEIQWDIDRDEVYERIYSTAPKDVAVLIGMAPEAFEELSAEDRRDVAYDKFRHCPALLDDFMGLPDEVDIPPELTDSEDISEWLSDKYGFCHEGFQLKHVTTHTKPKHKGPKNKKLYRVWAQCITDCYLDIEASSEDEARSIAIEKDGREFTSCERGAFNITDAYELD